MLRRMLAANAQATVRPSCPCRQAWWCLAPSGFMKTLSRRSRWQRPQLLTTRPNLSETGTSGTPAGACRTKLLRQKGSKMLTSHTVSPLRRRFAFDRLQQNASPRSLFMLACCLMMAAGMAIVLASAPAGASFTDRFLPVLPLAGCLAMHLVLHRFMGGCVHQGSGDNRTHGDKSNA